MNNSYAIKPSFTEMFAQKLPLKNMEKIDFDNPSLMCYDQFEPVSVGLFRLRCFCELAFDFAAALFCVGEVIGYNSNPLQLKYKKYFGIVILLTEIRKLLSK